MTDDIRNLLGGYATGTLTEEEKKSLFEAALHDDALFAALADEQALKELLEDGAVRAQLLRATEEPRFTVLGALREWFEHPKSKALVATGTVLLAVIGVQQVRDVSRQQSKTSTMAELRVPAQPPAEAPQRAVDPLAAARQQPAPPRDSAPKTEPYPAARRTSVPQAAVATDVKEKRELERSTAAAPVTAERDEQTTSVSAVSPAPPPPPPPAPSAAKPAEAKKANEVLETGIIAGSAGAGPAMTAANSLRAPAAAAPRPAIAGGAAVGAFQRAAGTAVVPLRYELLRRNAAGEFQAVPADYVFAPGDTVRLRVTSTRNGVVGISSTTENQTISGAVVANTWTEVPSTGGYPISAKTEKLLVVLSPGEVVNTNLLDSAEARAKRTEASSVYLEIPIRQKRP